MTTMAERDELFRRDPAAYFEQSETAMHGISRHDLEQLQMRCLRHRVEHSRERIPMLGKLAREQGIAGVDDFDEALPLFFEHYVYKSYPSSLLWSGRFDQLTRFLGRLTTEDLSGVDVSGCATIDAWLDALDAQTGLAPQTSSGTTGTMSIVPKAKNDLDVFGSTARISVIQDFGGPPPAEDVDEPVHGVWPTFAEGHMSPFRSGAYFLKHVSLGRPEFAHPALSGRGSADVMYLAGRMASAEARGESPQVTVPPALLDRMDELKRLKTDMARAKETFLTTLTEDLAGQRVAGLSAWTFFYEIATQGLSRGLRCSFAPGSKIFSGGGGKGVVAPDDLWEVLEDFLGVPIRMAYSMSEINALHTACTEGRIHLKPWVIPYVLDPETSKPLPRSGVRRGRAAFFDVCADGFWGGVITGDEIEIDWSERCACGRQSLHISPDIQRLSEKQGGNDKITCTATASAHADAMNYLTELA